jgi:hypothetical protein
MSSSMGFKWTLCKYLSACVKKLSYLGSFFINKDVSILNAEKWYFVQNSVIFI